MDAGPGAPVGNLNSATGKRWRKAIELALSRSSADGVVESGLSALADKLILQALNGEQWAMVEIGNRLDGKPAQQLIHSNDPDNPLTSAAKLSDDALAAIAAGGK